MPCPASGTRWHGRQKGVGGHCSNSVMPPGTPKAKVAPVFAPLWIGGVTGVGWIFCPGPSLALSGPGLVYTDLLIYLGCYAFNSVYLGSVYWLFLLSLLLLSLILGIGDHLKSSSKVSPECP